MWLSHVMSMSHPWYILFSISRNTYQYIFREFLKVVFPFFFSNEPYPKDILFSASMYFYILLTLPHVSAIYTLYPLMTLYYSIRKTVCVINARCCACLQTTCCYLPSICIWLREDLVAAEIKPAVKGTSSAFSSGKDNLVALSSLTVVLNANTNRL